MKTIGLIGGMSWESTVTYYQIINETVRQQLGGLHSAKLLLYSVDFAEIEHCQAEDDWETSARILSDAAVRLEGAGAELIAVCTNTMHKVVSALEARVGVPIVHIAQAAAGVLRAEGIRRVGLLGTRYTMTQDFYQEKLRAAGVEVLVPEGDDLELVHSVIYEELCMGVIRESSRRAYLEVIARLAERGAQGVLLGCTEIGLLIRQEDTPIPVFDTTLIHARELALRSLQSP